MNRSSKQLIFSPFVTFLQSSPVLFAPPLPPLSAAQPSGVRSDLMLTLYDTSSREALGENGMNHLVDTLWAARRSNQSILKEISPKYSLEGLMLKLKLQYSDHLMQRTDSSEKTLMLGKTEGRRRRGWQRLRWLNGIIHSDLSLSKPQEIVENREAWRAAVYGVTKSGT